MTQTEANDIIIFNGNMIRELPTGGAIVMRGKRTIYLYGDDVMAQTKAALQKMSFNRLFRHAERHGYRAPHIGRNTIGYWFKNQPKASTDVVSENKGSSLFMGGVLVAQSSHKTLTYQDTNAREGTPLL